MQGQDVDVFEHLLQRAHSSVQKSTSSSVLGPGLLGSVGVVRDQGAVAGVLRSEGTKSARGTVRAGSMRKTYAELLSCLTTNVAHTDDADVLAEQTASHDGGSKVDLTGSG